MSAMDREALLSSVKALVEAEFSADGLQTEVFPDDPDEFIRKYLKSQQGALLLSYAGGRKIQRSGEYAKDRLFVVDLVVLARAQLGDAGALSHLRRLEAVLDGRRMVTGAGQAFDLETLDDTFLGEENKVWQYLLRLGCSLV